MPRSLILLSAMKPKQGDSGQEQQLVSAIYQKIVEKMQILDQLNAEYKVKQEEHFLKTFMNVLEKMGNDLILAQEAYRNVDLEARKDNYCLLLASQLSFFKEQAHSLREALTAKEKEWAAAKAEREAAASELKFMRQGFQSKVRECMRLRAEVQELKKQVRFLSDPANNSIFKFTNPEDMQQSGKKGSSLTNYLHDTSLDLKPIPNRLLATNCQQRRKNNSLTLQVRTARPPAEGPSFELRTNGKQEGSTHSSFRKKLISQHLNRTALHLYQPID